MLHAKFDKAHTVNLSGRKWVIVQRAKWFHTKGGSRMFMEYLFVRLG